MSSDLRIAKHNSPPPRHGQKLLRTCSSHCRSRCLPQRIKYPIWRTPSAHNRHRGGRACMVPMENRQPAFVSRALASSWRVPSWCFEHKMLSHCKPGTCVLCMLGEDMASLSMPAESAFVPLIALNRTMWSPSWTAAKQECAMEAMSMLIDACEV